MTRDPSETSDPSGSPFLQGPKTTQHLDPEALKVFVSGELPQSMSDTVGQHLTDCAACSALCDAVAPSRFQSMIRRRWLHRKAAFRCLIRRQFQNRHIPPTSGVIELKSGSVVASLAKFIEHGMIS